MLLLNFTSALKYILGLLLAFIGLLPYEAIEEPHKAINNPVEKQPEFRQNDTLFNFPVALAADSLFLIIKDRDDKIFDLLYNPLFYYAADTTINTGGIARSNVHDDKYQVVILHDWMDFRNWKS